MVGILLRIAINKVVNSSMLALLASLGYSPVHAVCDNTGLTSANLQIDNENIAIL